MTENQERLWLKYRKFVLMIIKQYCGFTEDLEDLDFLESDQDIEEAVTFSLYRKEFHEELDQAMETLE